MTSEPSWQDTENKRLLYYSKCNMSEIKGVTVQFCAGNRTAMYNLILHIESMLTHNTYRIRTYATPGWWHINPPSIYGWKVTLKASKLDINLINLTLECHAKPGCIGVIAC